jgi:uncharacterized damage-inducible protein DinB
METTMDKFWKETVWNQFGAAIDTLENAINACPDELWADRTRRAEFWYVVSHTLFWLDYYLSESHENFAPPEPFGLEELDPAGVIPERPYTKQELLTYLAHGRAKCRETIANLTDESARRPYKFGKVDLSFAELLLYNMRHVQHHSAQLNFILRETHDIGSRWVFRAKTGLE